MPVSASRATYSERWDAGGDMCSEGLRKFSLFVAEGSVRLRSRKWQELDGESGLSIKAGIPARQQGWWEAQHCWGHMKSVGNDGRGQAGLYLYGLDSGSGKRFYQMQTSAFLRAGSYSFSPTGLGFCRCWKAAPVARGARGGRADTYLYSLTDYLSGGFSSLCLWYLPSVLFGLFVCLKED